MADITHKRGDTFDQTIVLPDSIADGEMVGWTGTSQLRTARGALVADLAVSWPDDPVRRNVRLFFADTTGWQLSDPHALHVMDVEFVRTSDGYVRSTDTMTVAVIEDVTR